MFRVHKFLCSLHRSWIAHTGLWTKKKNIELEVYLGSHVCERCEHANLFINIFLQETKMYIPRSSPRQIHECFQFSSAHIREIFHDIMLCRMRKGEWGGVRLQIENPSIVMIFWVSVQLCQVEMNIICFVV